MSYDNLSIGELQSAGMSGDDAAIMALGKRVLDFDFCNAEDVPGKRFCTHLQDLRQLHKDLNNEIPDDCPHCGKFITDK